MRNLASIQTIADLQPIEGADKIEVAQVLGWTCVVRRGEFKVGDKCVYIEIDSIVPDRPVFEFLRDRKFRVKTIKLRGQISQGLALPLSSFPELSPDIEIGTDVTEQLGITKYDTYEQGVQTKNAKIKGNTLALFPKFIPKTDEIRIQAVPEAVRDLAKGPYYVTMKRDGTSATFFVVKHGRKIEFGVCSRTRMLKDYITPEPSFMSILIQKVLKYFIKSKQRKNTKPPLETVYWQMAHRYNLPNKMKEIARSQPDGYGFAIQGEIFGPGIQQNRMGAKDVTLEIFNGFDIQNQRYFTLPELQDMCMRLGVQMVPILPCDFSSFLTPDKTPQEIIKHLVEYADTICYENGEPAEGIVIRSTHNLISPALKYNRLSFKVISPKFLLRWGL